MVSVGTVLTSGEGLMSHKYIFMEIRLDKRNTKCLKKWLSQALMHLSYLYLLLNLNRNDAFVSVSPHNILRAQIAIAAQTSPNGNAMMRLIAIETAGTPTER